MSKLKSSLLTIAAVATVGGAVMGGSALAATHNSDNGDTLVQKIATRFNLNKDDVQKVVEEFHDQKQDERQQKLSEYLQIKVDDNTITAEQKTLLENKIEEMYASRKEDRDVYKNMTPEQRRDAKKAKHDEFKKWAEDNNISLEKLNLPVHGHHRPGGARHLDD